MVPWGAFCCFPGARLPGTHRQGQVAVPPSTHRPREEPPGRPPREGRCLGGRPPAPPAPDVPLTARRSRRPQDRAKEFFQGTNRNKYFLMTNPTGRFERSFRVPRPVDVCRTVSRSRVCGWAAPASPGHGDPHLLHPSLERLSSWCRELAGWPAALAEVWWWACTARPSPLPLPAPDTSKPPPSCP